MTRSGFQDIYDALNFTFYESVSELGKGNTATVKRGTQKGSGKVLFVSRAAMVRFPVFYLPHCEPQGVAVKFISKERLKKEQQAKIKELEEEIELMRRIVHPHCIQLIEGRLHSPYTHLA